MYPTHALLTFGGVLNSTTTPTEIWQCGIRFIGGAANGFMNDPQAFAEAAVTPLSTWFQDPTSKCATNARLSWVKCNNITADGKYADVVTHVKDLTSPVAGGTAASVPDILGCALSWVTDASRGPAHTGRIYPPNYGVAATNGSPIVSPTMTSGMAAAGWTLIQNLSAITDGGASVLAIVASKLNASSRPIVGARVGSVMDVQRRRKSAMASASDTTKPPRGPFPAGGFVRHLTAV